MERQYCASAYTINSEDKILLMFNKKLKKWLQPGGHIEGNETPVLTAIRETFEETGINIEIIGDKLFLEGEICPVAVERYVNKVGDMIDIQYLAKPLNLALINFEENKAGFFSIDELKEMNVDEEIVIKCKKLIVKKNIL